jgi:hypothetical protein
VLSCVTRAGRRRIASAAHYGPRTTPDNLDRVRRRLIVSPRCVAFAPKEMTMIRVWAATVLALVTTLGVAEAQEPYIPRGRTPSWSRFYRAGSPT